MTDRARYLHGLDLLRVVASLAVLYTHADNWLTPHGHRLFFVSWIDDFVIAPLHLNPRLSFFGVALFLVVSGLVVTLATEREGPGRFLWRRMSRLVPVLVLVTALGWGLINLGGYVSESGQRSMDLPDLLKAATLAGFFSTPELIVLGVAWTLVAQVLFFGYVAATIPLLRRHPWVPAALAAALVCAALSLSTGSPDLALRRIGVSAAMFPVLTIGSLIALVRMRKLRPEVATALGVVHFLLFVWADSLGGQHLQTGTEHPRTLALVVLVVLLAMGAQGGVSRSRLVAGWSRRTYVIYLVHPLCLYPILGALAPRTGPYLALLAALLAIAVVTETIHRGVELPANRWLRSRERARGRPTVTL